MRAVFAHGWPRTDGASWVVDSHRPHPLDIRRVRRDLLPSDDGSSRSRWPRGPERTLIEVTRLDFDLAREHGLRTTMHAGARDLGGAFGYRHDATTADRRYFHGGGMVVGSIESVDRQIGKHPVRVFTYAGKPLDRANTHAWQKALKRAAIENFRWHDIRHTWATWHRQSGTPTHELQRLGGWRSSVMVERYAHLAPDHLARAANCLDSMFRGYDLATRGKDKRQANTLTP